jgi:Fe-S oxidoreductase
VAWPVRSGTRTPGKVAIFATCYVNYNEPGIGHDLLRILEHNEVPYRLVEQEACCGMPKLELGDLDAVEALKNTNIGTTGRARERRLCHPDRGPVVHAHVEARVAADVSG